MDIQAYQAQLIDQVRLWQRLIMRANAYLDLRIDLLGLCNRTLDDPLRGKVFTLIDRRSQGIWERVEYRRGRRESLDYAIHALGYTPPDAVQKKAFTNALQALDTRQRKTTFEKYLPTDVEQIQLHRIRKTHCVDQLLSAIVHGRNDEIYPLIRMYTHHANAHQELLWSRPQRLYDATGGILIPAD